MVSKLKLEWNDHSNVFGKNLQNFFLKDLYADSNLYCEGQIIPVHRLVLSTSSEYFEKLFSQCSNFEKQPLIIIKDIELESLKYLLNFIYKGEVNLKQEQLATFIKIADTFKVKGISSTEEEEAVTKVNEAKKYLINENKEEHNKKEKEFKVILNEIEKVEENTLSKEEYITPSSSRPQSTNEQAEDTAELPLYSELLQDVSMVVTEMII